ncbi:MAG: Plug domain-containing protein, partial [Pseudomonadales bacterium]
MPNLFKTPSLFLVGTFAGTLLASSQLHAQIEEIVVTADFYQTSAMDIASSVTIVDEQMIERRHAEHLEQLFGLAPNVNYATGASRGRFIQIRGIGERSEYIEPVNYSVGVLIDGIDFTGISTAASTLDIQQVEILRGPQGTLYGANALAGLINLVSVDPTETTQG